MNVHAYEQHWTQLINLVVMAGLEAGMNRAATWDTKNDLAQSTLGTDQTQQSTKSFKKLPTHHTLFPKGLDT